MSLVCRKFHSALVWAPMAILLLADPTLGFAQVQRSGGGASAALMAEYQQALTEQSQLKADNDKLKHQLEDAQKDLTAAKRQITTLQSGAGSSQAALKNAQATAQTYEKSFTDTRAKLQELLARFRDTVSTMQGIETSRAQLQQQLTQSKATFDDCAKRNVELYQVDDEVLTRYEHQGMFGYLERGEPFTRLKRTQIENLVDGYRERATTLRVVPQAPVTPVRSSTQSQP
jgi:DNA repair exonuclease SbcCD ATPase subunit